jgi:glycerophosphoryl diester phosphodiesterase
LVIAHQGGDGLRPSNTLAAFEHAVALGVDVLEMDVHLTRDGALVVMHDATVDRTTNGSGALAALSLAQVRELDAGFHWPYDGEPRPYRGRGLGVPTFAEIAAAFPGHRLNVEIKPDSAAAGRAVCGAIRHLEHHRAACWSPRFTRSPWRPSAMPARRCPPVPWKRRSGVSTCCTV